MPSFSNSLESAIHFSLEVAFKHHEEIATLEHLLFALTYESDAITTMVANSVDVTLLRQDLENDFITNPRRTSESQSMDSLKPTKAFQRVIQRAAILSQSSGRTEVRGFDVLVAIFAERDSVAAKRLGSQNFTRYDAVNFIHHGISKSNFYSLDGMEIRFKYEPLTQDEEAKQREFERTTVQDRLQADSAPISLLARSIELQITDEIARREAAKPNFLSLRELDIYEKEMDFLRELAISLGNLAEAIATITEGDVEKNTATAMQETLLTRDRVFSFLAENKEDAFFYCAKMPAMLGSIALFSLAGAHMITATPILMAIFGGDKIVKLVAKEKQ